MAVTDAVARLRRGGPALARIWADHGIRAVVLFGSAARAPAQAADLDLAVDHDGDLDVLGLIRDLARELELAELDVLDLRRAGPVAAFEALRRPDVLFERADANLAQTCAVAAVRYADTAPLRTMRRRSLAT